MREAGIALIAVRSMVAGHARVPGLDLVPPTGLTDPFNSRATVSDGQNVEPLRPGIYGTPGVVITGNHAATMIGIEELENGSHDGAAAAMAA